MKGILAVLTALMLSACISVGGIASEPPMQNLTMINTTNDSVKFVVFSDLHIGLNETNNTYKMFHYNEKVVSDMVNEVNGMKDVSFVLIVGDLTKDSEPKNHKRVLDILSKLNKPYYITPGNHDVMKKGMPAENWGAAELVKNYPLPWRKGSLSYSVDVAPGVHLVSLDSASDKSHFANWGGATSFEDLKWMDEDLAKNKDKTTILMTHHALNHHEGANDPLYYNDNSSQIKQVLSKYDANLAITGHIHITNIAKNGTLTDMSVPSTSTYPLSYTIWQLSGTQAKVHTVWYNNQSTMNISKQEFIAAKNNVTQAEGTPSDRDAIISLTSLASGATKTKANDLAKAVILMIGDGMGYSEIAAARMEKAGMNLSVYNGTSLNLDHLDYDGYVSTYSADSFITDSAPASTAMATGHKTNNGVISQDSTAVTKKQNGKNLTTILELAEKAGMSTGVVSTTRITHATPAAFYSHVNDRDNEAEIANQLVASGVDVVLGGGLKFFVGTNQTTPAGGKSKRNDNKNILNESIAKGYTFVYNGTSFEAVNSSSTKMLLGLFDDDHMLYELQRANVKDPEPSLANLTDKAIQILSKNPKGYFLMVEGGRIDHASHAMSYNDTIADTLAFDAAVKIALDYANSHNDTLVIVTADHETGGLSLGAKDPAKYQAGVSLLFASGLIKIPGSENNYTTTTLEATHTAPDVPIMAMGPGAEKVSHGRLDNTQIFGIMKDGLGI
jgi:alkaline phosphatase